ncbi:MAG: helix-turn-helix domain-containing protein [Victivallaceae bacterium]
MNAPRNYPVRLNRVNVSKLTATYFFPKHYQKCHQLYLVLEGRVFYEADGVELVLEGGDGLWLAPGCLRAPRSGCDQGSYLVAEFSTHHANFCPRGVRRIRLDAEGRTHAEALRDGCLARADDAVLMLLFARFCLAVSPELVLPESAVSETRLTRDEQTVRSIEKLMQVNLGNPLSLETLCRLVHSSRSSVVRSFRRRLGLAPMEHYRALRLERARELLNSGLSIAETAAATGFSSTQHLATACRLKFKATPSELVRNCTKKS